MSDLAVIAEILGLDDDDALFVLELCDMLERERQIEAHGYPKDTPTGRNLAERLSDAEFRRALYDLAAAEGADEGLLQALA